MNANNADKVIAFFSIERIHVRFVLEEVCVNFARLNSIVRSYVIGELYYFECDSFFSKVVYKQVKNCCMWLRSCSNSECLVLLLLCAAGKHNSCREQYKCFCQIFH